MRLIDANALKEQIYIMQNLGANIPIMHMIENAPTIDAVEVVQCENCRHFEDEDEDGNCWCLIHDDFTKRGAFCSWGKRKNEIN